ncbi:metallophosphoesterase family protein [Acidithiobacillus caldus]|nr:metallophosphoesterase [Acidithiobacillus caldus]
MSNVTIAHLSDLHFAPEHLEEVDHCMHAAVTEIQELPDLDAVVISGDATDHRIDLHSPSAQRLAAHVRALAEKAPVLMLQGTFSHEPLGTLDIFRHIRGRYPVYVASEIHQVALTRAGEWISSLGQDIPDYVFSGSLPEGTKILCSCLPTVNKADMVATVGADDHTALGDVLTQLLQDFAPSNLAARSAGIPTVGVSHGTVHGCLTEQGVPMMGFDHEFTVGSLFSAQASAFLLGHIHKHQEWDSPDQRRIAYPGSIGRLHYGEAGEKGWLLWDVGPDSARCVLHPTPSRQLLHIDFDGTPDVEAIRQAVKDAPGAFVRIRYHVPEDQRHSVDRDLINQVVQQAGGRQCKIEGRILPVTRVRAEGISQGKTLQDKLRRWCETTETPAEPLLERLEWLLKGDAPEIVVQQRLKLLQRTPAQESEPDPVPEDSPEATEPSLPPMDPPATVAVSAEAPRAAEPPKEALSLMDLF